MKKYFAFLLLFFVYSCSPNSDERAALQASREDSIIKAVEKATVQRMELIFQLRADRTSLLDKRGELMQKIKDAELNLEIQKDRLQRIKAPRLLRTSFERTEQVRTQLTLIDEATSLLEANSEALSTCKKNLLTTQNKLDLLEPDK